jgi:hypothetical protein
MVTKLVYIVLIFFFYFNKNTLIEFLYNKNVYIIVVMIIYSE